MKKYFIVILLFTSCYQLKDIPAHKEVIIFDFNQYVKEGFYFFANEYFGKYESLGIIDINYYPAYRVKKSIIYDSEKIEKSIKILEKEEIAPEFILNLVYKEAIELGANAVYNFRCSSADEIIKEETIIEGINIYCVAIKIN